MDRRSQDEGRLHLDMNRPHLDSLMGPYRVYQDPSSLRRDDQRNFFSVDTSIASSISAWSEHRLGGVDLAAAAPTATASERLPREGARTGGPAAISFGVGGASGAGRFRADSVASASLDEEASLDGSDAERPYASSTIADERFTRSEFRSTPAQPRNLSTFDSSRGPAHGYVDLTPYLTQTEGPRAGGLGAAAAAAAASSAAALPPRGSFSSTLHRQDFRKGEVTTKK